MTGRVAGTDDFTPLQLRTLALLRKGPEPLVFAEEFVAELTEAARTALDEFAERVGDVQVFLSKSRLSDVFGCEARLLAGEDFTWTTRLASGIVAHRAVELLLNRRVAATPAQLVDEAYEQLADDPHPRSAGPYLAGLPEPERALLRSDAVERVTAFEESFPPLPHSVRVQTEARVRWPADGAVVMQGKVDLVIGTRPQGRVSHKVLVDLKTGTPWPSHREDLRFYALLETLRSGVPPRKLASYYLDAGDAQVEDVTEAVLRTALRRTLDGVDRLIELQVEGAEPVKRVGAACGWCPLGVSGECAEGAAYLTARDAG